MTLLSSREVSEMLGGIKTASVSSVMRRAGVKAVGREPGRGGVSLWDAEDVAYALAKRRGHTPTEGEEHEAQIAKLERIQRTSRRGPKV